MKFNVIIDRDEDRLIEDIYAWYSHEDIVKFIIKLEKYYEDWDITEQLYEYFSKEIKILEKEIKEND
jgi:hypothetical protein